MRRLVHSSYDLIASVGLFGLAIALLHRAVFKGEIFVERDTRVFYYPLHAWFTERLKRFEFPLWSPDFFGGFPIFADGETGMFYPPVALLSFFLPTDTAFVWNLVLHFFFAGIFTYCFCRALELTRLASVLGGASFMLSGFLVAQIHHQNLLDSAVWLPLILCFIERAARSSGGRRQINLAFAGVAFGFQCLGVHVQVPLMSSLVIGGYVTVRFLLCPIGGSKPRLVMGLDPWQQGWIRRYSAEELDRLFAAAKVVLGRLFIWAWALAVVPAVAGGLAAVQLLPLFELGTFSRRAGGVDYAFATLFPQTPINLLTIVFPFLFTSTPDGFYWGLWSAWETRVYVGLVPLVLAVVAIVAARRRLVYFWLAVGVLALWIGMAGNAPIFNLHAFLFQFPGFNQMRAPGRYALLFMLSVAVMAAYGMSFLEQHLRREWRLQPAGPGPIVARIRPTMRLWLPPLLAGFGLVLVLAFELLLRIEETYGWITGSAPDVTKWIETVYLAAPRDRRLPDEALTVQRVYDGLRAAFDPSGFAVSYTLVFLFVPIGVLYLWLALPWLRRFWQSALLILLCVDLLFTGWQFHPAVSTQQFSTMSPAVRFLKEQTTAQPGKVFTRQGASTAPNSLMTFDIPEFGGYSSLGFTRHEEYTGALERAYPQLLDSANVRYVVESTKYVPTPSYEATPFNPNRPIISTVSTANAAASASFTVENGFAATSVRVVSRMRNAVNVAQNTPVFEVSTFDARGALIQRWQLLAGVHTGEWAMDRPDVKPLVKHNRPPVAFTMKEPDAEGVMRDGSLFYADLPLRTRTRVNRLEIKSIIPGGDVQVSGLTMVDDGSRPAALKHFTPYSSDRFQRIYEDAETIIYENKAVLPRAYFAPNAVVRAPGKTSIDIFNFMTENAFDPRREVVFEQGEAPDAALAQTGQRPEVAWKTAITAESDNGITLDVTTAADQYLVLADTFYPGWKAFIDGNEVPIYRANYLFRGIVVPAGQHTVEFRFDSASFWTGFRITTGVAIGLIATWLLWRLGIAAILAATLFRAWHRRGGHWRTFPLPRPVRRQPPRLEPDWGVALSDRGQPAPASSTS